MELSETEIDNELIEIERERIIDKIKEAKNLRNQALDLCLNDLLEYDREGEIIQLGGAINLIEIISDFNDAIYKLKEELNNISK